MKTEKLTIDIANQIGGALQRLNEIGSATIIDPKNEAEQRALVTYLGSTLPQYANELLTCWFVIRTEYQPLVNSCAAILRRATAPIAQPEANK